MKTEYFLFIIISAFFHASFNLLMKRSLGNRSFLFCAFFIATIISIMVTMIAGDYKNIPWQLIPYVFGASFFYILYQILVSKSYENGDISALYPLTVLSPIFIPIWAYIFLSEKITLLAGLGILITVVGAIIIKLNSFTLDEFKKIFTLNKEYLGARFALGASFMYSIGAIFDKSKIAFFPISTYLTIILFFMSLNILIYLALYKRQQPFQYITQHWKSALFGGITLYLSFFFFRFALKEVLVSIIVPIRQTSIIFAILLGVLMLKEKFEISNLIGSMIIILGITLINFSI